ncbi:MAG: tetratricopeptide repeat protein [Cytophagaceae bacterium]|nr:tetratricopeptide repeat protein [Cytophagaceae bacterium]
MKSSRLKELLKFLEEDPGDTFTIYALALEYTRADENKALEYYNHLLKEHESYIPTYYHAGKLYQKRGNLSEAESIYLKGMELSQKARNFHAYNELQGAYNQLKGHEDDE